MQQKQKNEIVRIQNISFVDNVLKIDTSNGKHISIMISPHENVVSVAARFVEFGVMLRKSGD